MNNLQHNLLFPMWFVLDVEDGLECVVDVRISCKFMSSCTLGFITSLPSQQRSSGIEVHCSHNAVAEVSAGNVRWELNVPGDFIVYWNPNDNSTIYKNVNYSKEGQK